jgi:hypothetical protein
MEETIARQLKFRVRLIYLALFCLIAPPLILFLLLGLPVIGNAVVLSLADHLGCTVNASGPHPCYFLGTDIGGIVYTYAIGSLFAGAFNPIYFLGAVTTFIPAGIFVIVCQAWLFLVVSLIVLAALAKQKLRLLANSSFKPNPLRGSA